MDVYPEWAFSGRNADEQSLKISGEMLLHQWLIARDDCRHVPHVHACHFEGEKHQEETPRTQDGDTLCWLPEVDRHRAMSGPSALLHSLHTAALSWQGGVHLPLQELQMSMPRLGGGEAKRNISNFSSASAWLRRSHHKTHYPPLLIVMLTLLPEECDFSHMVTPGYALDCGRGGPQVMLAGML